MPNHSEVTAQREQLRIYSEGLQKALLKNDSSNIESLSSSFFAWLTFIKQAWAIKAALDLIRQWMEYELRNSQSTNIEITLKKTVMEWREILLNLNSAVGIVAKGANVLKMAIFF